MNWTPLSHHFVADSTTTMLQLRSRMLGFNGVVFDSVSVTRVPEPAAIVAMSFLIATAMILRVRRTEMKTDRTASF
jgi:hypothetical protein